MAKKIFSCACFFACLIIVLLHLNQVMSFKNGDGIYDLTIFYEQEENTIDTMFFGSSHIFEDVNTAVLWDEHGIASYALCGSIQPLWNTYFYINEALKYQTPELIVVDTYLATFGTEYSDNSRIAKNNYGLKFSGDKIESVQVSAPKEEQLNYLLEYPTYHSRYNELKKADFLPYQGRTNYFQNWKGHGTNFVTKVLETPKVDQMTSIMDIPEKNREYLQKIIDLSKEKEIPLLLVTTPYQVKSSEQAIYNSVEILAYNEGIPYVNFNKLYNEIGLNFSSDFADGHHLNHRGNAKFTTYLGNYLKKNYNLSDKRGNPVYRSYDENLTNWMEQLNNQEMKETSNLDIYLPKLNNNNLITIVSVNGDIVNDLSKREFEYFSNLGLKHENLLKNHVAVVKGGEILLASEYSSNLSWSYELPESGFLNIRDTKVNINGVNHYKKNNGLNIITYNIRTNEIIESIIINKENPGVIKR